MHRADRATGSKNRFNQSLALGAPTGPLMRRYPRCFRGHPLALPFRASSRLLINLSRRLQLPFRTQPNERKIVDENAVREVPVIDGMLGNARDVAKSTVNLACRRGRTSDADLGMKRDGRCVCHFE
jgi:hypothetical protein